VLLREVHHRVKNNLQLIASIMNMQLRQSNSPEAKTLMKGLQDRVMSLATIHRGLYQTTGLADVRADELLPDILRQILKMATGPGRRFDVETHFDDLRLTPDQAVPLSLLLTEALTNAIKYAGTDGTGVPKLEVSLRRSGQTDAVLSVTNSIGSRPAAVEGGSTGLGSQLLAAFGQQLGAQSETSLTDATYALRVTFAVRALADGEVGRAPNGLHPESEPGQADQTFDQA
jgi:two-component system, sensor histidine kinase PdtaS